MTTPFKTPITIASQLVAKPRYELLVGADHETIAECWSSTKAELQEIVKRVNAYDQLVQIAKDHLGNTDYVTVSDFLKSLGEL
jgi:hypothetical protein